MWVRSSPSSTCQNNTEKRFHKMRAQPLSPRESQVVNQMVMMRRSDEFGLTAVPTYERWGKIVKFTAFTTECDRRFTSEFQVSLKRTDQLIVRPIIPEGALFQHLVHRWHQERGATSSITQMAMCRSYQRIIGMGRSVAVPLILQDLASKPENPDHWFWALRALTDDDPVPDYAQGDMRQMANAWLDWGRRNGYA